MLQWHQFIRRPEARPHVIFLSDYDMLLTERLVQGVDIWINTPRRPWEASGTSGMKVPGRIVLGGRSSRLASMSTDRIAKDAAG